MAKLHIDLLHRFTGPVGFLVPVGLAVEAQGQAVYACRTCGALVSEDWLQHHDGKHNDRGEET